MLFTLGACDSTNLADLATSDPEIEEQLFVLTADSTAQAIELASLRETVQAIAQSPRSTAISTPTAAALVAATSPPIPKSTSTQVPRATPTATANPTPIPETFIPTVFDFRAADTGNYLTSENLFYGRALILWLVHLLDSTSTGSREEFQTFAGGYSNQIKGSVEVSEITIGKISAYEESGAVPERIAPFFVRPATPEQALPLCAMMRSPSYFWLKFWEGTCEATWNNWAVADAKGNYSAWISYLTEHL